MPASIFDATSFMETEYKGGLDTTYVNPDEGDYLAQITARDGVEPIEMQSGRDANGRAWALFNITWELMDDVMKQKLNLDRIFCRQSLFVDILEEPPGSNRFKLDLGVNKSMALKRLLEVTGLNTRKAWNMPMLKFQTALVHVRHRPDPDDASIIYAEVSRVASSDKLRVAAQ